jgi:fatty acid desaturase
VNYFTFVKGKLSGLKLNVTNMSDKSKGYEAYLNELKSGKTELPYDQWLIEKNQQEKGILLLAVIASTFVIFWMFRLQALIFQALFKFMRVPLKDDIKYGRGFTIFMAVTLVLVMLVNIEDIDKNLRLVIIVLLAMVGNWFFYSMMLRLTNLGLPLFHFWKKEMES